MTPEQRTRAELLSCSEADNRTWDLGTGSAQEIRTHAPSFYRLRRAGWTLPDAPLAREDAERARKEIDRTNTRRKDALERATLPDGIEQSTELLDDIAVYAFQKSGTTSSKLSVFAVSQDNENIVLLVSGATKCPLLRATDSCESDRLQTRVEVVGETACIGGAQLAHTNTEITADLAGKTFRGTLAMDVPLVIPSSEFGIDLRRYRSQRASPLSIDVVVHLAGRDPIDGTIELDNVTKATPETVRSFLRAGGLELAASWALSALSPKDKPPAFIASLEAIRMEGVRVQAETIRTAKQAHYVLTRQTYGAGLPGDEAAASVLAPPAKKTLTQLSSGPKNEETFSLWLAALKNLNRLGEYNDDDRVMFEEAFGPLVAEGAFNEKVENAFLDWVPNSPYASMLLQRRASEQAEAGKVAAAERRKQEAAEKKEEAAERAQCVARCDHRCMDWRYANKALCRQGCRNYECDQNYCIGACQADCSTVDKAGQPGCVSACTRGRCGQ